MDKLGLPAELELALSYVTSGTPVEDTLKALP